MKKYFICILCFLLAIASIPIIAVFEHKDYAELLDVVSQTDDEINTEKEDIKENIVANVMEYVKEDANIETKKAVMAVCINNYKYNLQNNISMPDYSIANYSDEYLEELCNLYTELDVEIKYEDKTVYIPLVKYCGEYTSESDDYPYMTSVATPWEMQRSDFYPDYDYPCGISVYSIEYLCENGSDCKSALRWFLPDFEIT